MCHAAVETGCRPPSKQGSSGPVVLCAGSAQSLRGGFKPPHLVPPHTNPIRISRAGPGVNTFSGSSGDSRCSSGWESILHLSISPLTTEMLVRSILMLHEKPCDCISGRWASPAPHSNAHDRERGATTHSTSLGVGPCLLSWYPRPQAQPHVHCWSPLTMWETKAMTFLSSGTERSHSPVCLPGRMPVSFWLQTGQQGLMKISSVGLWHLLSSFYYLCLLY